MTTTQETKTDRAERLKREITEYRKRLAASDHPMKAVKLKQLQALLDRLGA